MADTAALAPQLQAYLQHVASERRLAARTVALYTEGLQQLQALAAEAGPAVLALQPQHIRRFVASLHAKGRHGRSIALWLSCWRGFFRWAAWQGWVERNPVEGIRAPKTPKPLPKALGVDAAVQLADYRNPEADPWEEARDAAMTELLYSSGLRVSELANLDVQAGDGLGWLDLQAGLVHVTGKGGKRRSVPVGAPARAAVQRWLAIRPTRFAAGWSAPALFLGVRGARITPQTIWLRLRQRSQQAGLAAAVHPHVLRHSFASHVLQSSGDLRAVQELLGHANITTTQVYTRLDFQHLAQAYEQAHPRARKKSP
ncbi:tyrosine recombinase XerC [Comamonas aquatica]|jgi:integrase/recombinase XerC|uniref:Tyrosine recombinase XerC n=3 Tax=Comamonadaceae TaxID=80864 RepID=A0AA42HP38_9BURK|nr:tyrosine recombinase XerC [Comamonas aquatica]MDH0361628.1 tyrosine recombinase XerC [Comamonas aquatica]MDH0370613.1 tyrosine recombinase XerC [Comamonas aquatica]MDH1764777.1 tyrosine recombinase XerC [Comamonas aquatica]